MDNLLQKLMLGGSTAALVAAMSVTGAQAQSSGGSADIEQVVVSASRITIAGYTQPTPVTVVGVAQLEKDAFSNISDAVRELPSVSMPPSSNGAQNGGGFTGNEGADILNLRDLGVTRTLVLFDGQRTVQSNIIGGVDISTLPSAVIQRVDVVTGGASAAWGSDAVAGVVNFVLNKNFYGFKGSVEASDTYNDSYEGLKMQAMWGGDFAGGRGHLEFATEASFNPQTVTQTAENWYRGAYLVSNPAYTAGGTQPHLIVANNVGFASATPGGIIVSSPKGTTAAANALRGIEFVGAGNTQLVNYGNLTLNELSNGGSLTQADGEQNMTIIAIPQNRYSLFGYGAYRLTSNIRASLQLNYGYTTIKSFAQPAAQTAAVIHSDNAFLPASVASTMAAGGITSFTMGVILDSGFPVNSPNPDSQYFSTAEGSLGPASELGRRQLMRGVAELDGTIGDNWSWNAYYQHSIMRYTVHMYGDPVTSRIPLAEDAVRITSANVGTSGLPLGSIACRSTITAPTNGCIPLDIFGNDQASPAAIAYIDNNEVDQEQENLNQDEVSASMQGTLPWQLPAGPVAVAFGAGYRKEGGAINADPLGGAGAYNISNFLNFRGQYYVYEGFGEVDAPIIKNGSWIQSLDVTAAGRMTSYSTSGLVETWKLGATSQVNDDVKLRTTWSVDIRAPDLSELYAPGQFSNGDARDPKTGVSSINYSDTSGNPNLNPEVARTISAGVVLTPHWIDGLTASVDYYSINLTGVIASVSSNLILNTCTTNINDPLCKNLIFGNADGSLSQINLQPENLASQSTSGFDIQANYSMDFWNGNLAWQGTANYTDQLTLTQVGSPTDDYAGVMGAGGPSQTDGNPKWRGVISADYTTGPYSITVQSRWYGTGILNNAWGNGNLATPATANMVAVNHVPFTAYLDLRGSYKWNDNISVYGAIDNVNNIPPPLVPLYAANLIHSTPTSNTSYDMLGRQYRLGIRFNY